MKTMLLFAIVFVSCSHSKLPEDPIVWKKIKMDFRKFNNEGLAGPTGGQVSGNYEFCIPASEKYWKQVKKIDKTAERSGGKGRIGCSEKEWMVIGSTHQKNFQRVIFELASMPYIMEIQETFYE